jgi:RNA polymerase sigma factor (sigma-70 family)
MRVARGPAAILAAGALPASAPPASARNDGERGARTMAEAGDFAVVAPQHTAAMLRVAAALVGRADAEDAAQEALTHAWQAWETLRDPGAVRPWLLRITVNVCRHWQRGGFGRRVRTTEPLPEDDEGLALLDADLGTSDHTGSLDLRAAVNALELELRMLVALRYYGGMDASEIGLALHTPPATIRTRLRRALALLRDALGVSAPPGTRRRIVMPENTHDTDARGLREALPGDLHAMEERLTTDAILWQTQLPGTERLDAHARMLSSRMASASSSSDV